MKIYFSRRPRFMHVEPWVSNKCVDHCQKKSILCDQINICCVGLDLVRRTCACMDQLSMSIYMWSFMYHIYIVYSNTHIILYVSVYIYIYTDTYTIIFVIEYTIFWCIFVHPSTTSLTYTNFTLDSAASKVAKNTKLIIKKGMVVLLLIVIYTYTYICVCVSIYIYMCVHEQKINWLCFYDLRNEVSSDNYISFSVHFFYIEHLGMKTKWESYKRGKRNPRLKEGNTLKRVRP